MSTIDDLYRGETCPNLLWYVEVTLGGVGIPPLRFGTAYESGEGIKRLEASAPVFDFRADFSEISATASALAFAIDHEDEELLRQLADGYWEGRPATIYAGKPGWAAATYVPVFAGVVESIQYDLERATLAISARNAGLRTEIREEAFLGDGTVYEGGPEIEGNKKKMGFGICFNAEPQLTSHGFLTYQYCVGPARGCLQVFDNAIQLTKGPDIGPTEDIETLDPPADGTFRDQPSTGIFVLGAPPSDTSKITCTFEGMDTVDNPYADTTAGIIVQLLRVCGYTLLDCDQAALTELEAAYPYRVGIVVEEGETCQAAIARLMAGAHGAFGVGADSLFGFWLYRTRATESVMTIGEESIVSMARGPNLPPVDTLVINGAKNNTVQEQVARGADPEVAAFVSKPFRPYGPVNFVMNEQFPDAEQVVIDTLQYGQGDSAGDAAAFYAELAPSFLGVRATWLIALACQNFLVPRGKSVTIDTANLKLNDGPVYVERVRETLGGMTELTVTRTIAIV